MAACRGMSPPHGFVLSVAGSTRPAVRCLPGCGFDWHGSHVFHICNDVNLAWAQLPGVGQKLMSKAMHELTSIHGLGALKPWCDGREWGMRARGEDPLRNPPQSMPLSFSAQGDNVAATPQVDAWLAPCCKCYIAA